LQKDRLLAATDYQLWPEVAIVARKLALQTSTTFANRVLDQVFEREGSTKLRSHVWSALTLGVISHLTDGIFSRFDIYGPKTQHPQIRGDIESVIANDPSDPYIAFAYFMHGDLNKATTANHADLFSNVLHFGTGYTILLSLLEDALHLTKIDPKYRRHKELAERLKYSLDEEPQRYGHDNYMLGFFNSDQIFRDHKPIETVFPGAASRLAANMQASLGMPTATSVRTVPARLLEVNRQILNNQLARTTGAKVSFTHLIGYAVVKGLIAVPAMNAAFVEDADGKGTPGVIRHAHVGLGLAVDVEKPDGSRTLLVPCITEAGEPRPAARYASRSDSGRPPARARSSASCS